MSKKELGQFFTTNYKYILKDMYIPNNIQKIIEPFCGNGDLLEFIEDKNILIESYDIDPKKSFIKKQDTLLNPPNYNGGFILTNPPYLARNKCSNKAIFDKYNQNDLYKCFISNLLTNTCLGGIIIIPLNFISSIRQSDCDLRKDFLEKYHIHRINIFEEQVFDDTTYTICAIQFELKKHSGTIQFNIYPSKKVLNIELSQKNNYIIGGEIYTLQLHPTYKVSRLLEGEISNTNILLKCLDDNSKNMIQLKMIKDDEKYYGKNTSRTYASIQIEPNITIELQKKIVIEFNKLLKEYRDKYHSLFLTNYRESKDIARKRISFDLAYDLISHIIYKLI
jgi:hypothetical protein